ncbi:hypothetical protein MKW92_051403, partial [Papaver armeniacum]
GAELQEYVVVATTVEVAEKVCSENGEATAAGIKSALNCREMAVAGAVQGGECN